LLVERHEELCLPVPLFKKSYIIDCIKCVWIHRGCIIRGRQTIMWNLIRKL